jgi:hypothetical protein
VEEEEGGGTKPDAGASAPEEKGKGAYAAESQGEGTTAEEYVSNIL